jgi:rubredoxin
MAKRLSATGLPVEVENDEETQKHWLRVKPHAAAHVCVEEAALEHTETLLTQWEKELPSLIRCPQCGKSRVEYPQLTRRFPAPLWAFIPLVKLGFLKAECYCENCHFTWLPEPEPPEVEKDTLGWPGERLGFLKKK